MLLTALGKVWAQRFGLFEQRRMIQLIFVVVLALATLLAVAGALAATRNMDRAVRGALLGLAVIAAFVLLRAASFHHADAWLGAGPAGFNFGAIQEMAGIVIVAAAAWYYRRGEEPG
jgi:cell division protein FtsW (lipid II flippase)